MKIKDSMVLTGIVSIVSAGTFYLVEDIKNKEIELKNYREMLIERNHEHDKAVVEIVDVIRQNTEERKKNKEMIENYVLKQERLYNEISKRFNYEEKKETK